MESKASIYVFAPWFHVIIFRARLQACGLFFENVVNVIATESNARDITFSAWGHVTGGGTIFGS